MTCDNCNTRQLFPCRGCSKRLDSCANYCRVGPYCPTCQNNMNEQSKKVYANGIEYYSQLSQIASILNIPIGSHRNYNLHDAKWSDFFPNQVKSKWEQLKTSQLSPETQQSELLTENKQLTNQLGLKNRELKDLQAEIRALHTQLTEQENNSPYQVKINKLEVKLNLVKSKLREWNVLLTK